MTRERTDRSMAGMFRKLTEPNIKPIHGWGPNFRPLISNIDEMSSQAGAKNALKKDIAQTVGEIGLLASDATALRGLGQFFAPAVRRQGLRFTGRLYDDLPKNSFYRGIGPHGMDDALSSGVLRPKPARNPFGRDINPAYKDTYYSRLADKGKVYGGGFKAGGYQYHLNTPRFMATVPKSVGIKHGIKQAGPPRQAHIYRTPQEIPINQAKLLKEMKYTNITGKPKTGYMLQNP
jgi:hypothetical protein